MCSNINSYKQTHCGIIQEWGFYTGIVMIWEAWWLSVLKIEWNISPLFSMEYALLTMIEQSTTDPLYTHILPVYITNN